MVSIHVALNHVTHYRFDHPVALGPHLVRLRPAPHCRTRILSYALAVEPSAEQFPFNYDASEQRDLAPYLVKLKGEPRFDQYLAAVARARRATANFLVDLNSRLARDIRYLIRLEPGVQTPGATLALGSGSCRDSAWLLVQLLRHLGLAARFVSGYLVQLVPDVKSLDGPSGTSVDFTDLHAWCEVYLPGAGWIGLDPTSGLLAGEGHIPLAATAEPAAAAPVTGAMDPCEVQLEHRMQVTRIWEAPRVTKPYSDTQWDDINLLGKHVDGELRQQDVRLTMGGEPTFVSIDAPDAAEWNTAALGPDKRRLSVELFGRLRAEHAPQGLVHFGQGKWYPGEPLPRWSLNCFWRRDGQPIWHNAALLSDEEPDARVTSDVARQFLSAIAQRLGFTEDVVFAAYEDLYYYLWRERRLPSNVDAVDSKLYDPIERARIARLYEQGINPPVGFVLPLARSADAAQWNSSSWFLRRQRCYLVPGDSPLGYRLQLDSIPWVAAADQNDSYPPDPNQEFPPLAGTTARMLSVADLKAAARAPRANESADWVPRTALCCETRGGVLYVFMPPVAELKDYLELLALIETTASAMRQPIMLEGYEPPRDPRMECFRVTPDPGVIEVNIQPSSNWPELVARTTHLYEAARLTRLSSEKFMIDGRHTGTGGGNHVVLGGATPGDSPFLRRPDLLRSLLGYWHNHPSLSYLFAGLFVGPTSQAPRVDEARNDSLYELELAFKQLPPIGTEVPPWLVDRLFRNLLIDVTGNTHRAEFCIDKLYSPDGATGRLGLLEMRAFEMPPHAQMSLTQQLLLRALVAHFWKQPYQPTRLVRWGNELHDRFMLPFFIERDFRDVIAELRGAGFAFDVQWFAPHLEFRYPLLGDFTAAGVTIELRQALEPWHVMGEEGSAAGAVRYVDSSIERLQVRASGLASERYRLACNGQPIPMHATGTTGELVGAVRYRAWKPPSALHPNIAIHAPLTFDLVDTWAERSVGGCRYHVMHPGGRNYATFPVNALESESRRLARFERMGHTAGPIKITAAAVNPDFPFTLDLRGCPPE